MDDICDHTWPYACTARQVAGTFGHHRKHDLVYRYNVFAIRHPASFPDSGPTLAPLALRAL